MSKLDKKDVKHVAKLANLSLTEEEIEKFQKQLSQVIDYIEELSEVDTENIEPAAQTTGLLNKTRKDQAKPDDCLTQDEALSGTGKIHNGYFVVPMVLKERSI